MIEAQIKDEINATFQKHLGGPSVALGKLIPPAPAPGKLYEAFVLARVLEKLAVLNGYELTLVGGNKIYLKSGGGPINAAYPRIQLKEGGVWVADLWTDIEFTALSRWIRNAGGMTKGDYHELDILVVNAGTTGMPTPDAIWLGVECKDTGYQKSLLKEILGVRRELSFVQEPIATHFPTWPRTMVPAQPPSCLAVYSTDETIAQFAAPGEVFGIDFFYEPM